MACGLASRGVTLQFHLNTVVAGTRDVHRTALHQEVLLAVDGVLGGSRDIDGQVLHLYIFLTIDGMLRVTHHIERTLTLKLGMSLGMVAAVVVFVGTIRNGVGGILLRTDLNALTVLDVKGRPRGVCQRETVQFNRTFVGALHIELTVAGRATQRVDDLTVLVVCRCVNTGKGGILHYLHMRRSAAAHGDITADVISDGHCGC